MSSYQFFEVFNFALAEGDIKKALSKPNSVLVTKKVAAKYFDKWETALGKTLKLYGQVMAVNGILENPPANTDFPLSLVVSYPTLLSNVDPNDWGSISDENYCFVQVNDNASLPQVSKLLDVFVEKHIKPVNPGYDLALEPLNEMHFDNRYGNFNGRTFSQDLIFALNLIGIFLLVVACVNFINLTTAQGINRAREVGVRKVLGSNRIQLMLQFIGETGITTLFALLAAIVVAFLCLPFVNHLLEINLTIALLLSTKFVLFIAGTLILVTFLSGFYPAIVLSGFKSIQVLKSSVNASAKGIYFRRSLVVFQFVIAQVLIIGTLVVASQMEYFKNADLGFTKEAVINVGFPGDSLSQTKTDFLVNELHKVPGVQEVSISAFKPSESASWHTDLRKTTNQTPNPDMIVSMKPADTGYFHLYNLKLVAGRTYFPSDTMRELVLNETAIKNMGFQNPQDAIGKTVIVNGKTVPVVGVVKDFHIYSLKDPIGPIVLTTIKNQYGLTNVKVNIGQSKNVVAAMQKIWSNYFPDYVFEYSYLDQSIADYYKNEEQLSILYKVFSGIAIFISCLGLYGLISFMAVQRKKEIGIRKVLGAPVRDIVIMLSKELTLLITLAFVIATPIAWYFMHQWLQQYSYQIPLGLWFFIVTIVCSLIIAWLTVGYTAIKAAMANPVKSLRSE